MRIALESAEEMAYDTINAEWCDTLAESDAPMLEAVVKQLVAVQELGAEPSAAVATPEVVAMVSDLVNYLRKCIMKKPPAAAQLEESPVVKNTPAATSPVEVDPRSASPPKARTPTKAGQRSAEVTFSAKSPLGMVFNCIPDSSGRVSVLSVSEVDTGSQADTCEPRVRAGWRVVSIGTRMVGQLAPQQALAALKPRPVKIGFEFDPSKQTKENC